MGAATNQREDDTMASSEFRRDVQGVDRHGRDQGERRRSEDYGRDFDQEDRRYTQSERSIPRSDMDRDYGLGAYVVGGTDEYSNEHGRRPGRDAEGYGTSGTGLHGRGQHRGRGPRGYKRSDARIREDVSDRLSDDGLVDASEIEVTVEGAEVTLNGTVESREQKRRAEDCAESVSGVVHVQNNLRLAQSVEAGSRGRST
jgi:hypothetical protein